MTGARGELPISMNGSDDLGRRFELGTLQGEDFARRVAHGAGVGDLLVHAGIVLRQVGEIDALRRRRFRGRSRS
jgi:hypothetical protein